MEYAIWNGQIIIASEIKDDYSFEKVVRLASGNKELTCPDANCNSRVLRYCHGEVKLPYFAHIGNEHCDYAEFDKRNNQVIRNVRRIICDALINKGYKVQLEVKVLKRHYTHIIVELDEPKKLAIEIGTQQLSAARILALSEEYNRMNISVNWIVVCNPNFKLQENRTYFLKRYLLNESKNNDLLVISMDGLEIAQHKRDPNKYEYKGRQIQSVNYHDTYYECVSIDELSVENGELTISGYNLRYENWLNKKQRAFNKKVKGYEDAERYQVKQSFDFNKEPTKYVSSLSNESVLNDEIIRQLQQQEAPVYGMNYNRWLVCEKCGFIGTDGDFWEYGGQNRVNLGTCYDCSGRKRSE